MRRRLARGAVGLGGSVARGGSLGMLCFAGCGPARGALCVRWRRRMAQWRYVAMTAIVLGGCGSTHRRPSPPPRLARFAHCSTRDAASQAGAAALLLDRVSQPRGLRPVPLDPDVNPPAEPGLDLSQPSAPPPVAGGFFSLPRMADCYRWWIASGSLQQVLGRFNGRVRGSLPGGNGTNTTGHGIHKRTMLADQQYAPPTHPAGWTSQIVITVAPLGPGRVGVRADGEVAAPGQPIPLKDLKLVFGRGFHLPPHQPHAATQ